MTEAREETGGHTAGEDMRAGSVEATQLGSRSVFFSLSLVCKPDLDNDAKTEGVTICLAIYFKIMIRVLCKHFFFFFYSLLK